MEGGDHLGGLATVTHLQPARDGGHALIDPTGGLVDFEGDDVGLGVSKDEVEAKPLHLAEAEDFLDHRVW